MEHKNTPQFADRLPVLIDAIRGSGIVDAAGELLQVLASLILMRETRSPESGNSDYSQLASVEDRADARLALVKLWWQAIPRVLKVPRPAALKTPQLITGGGSAAARVVDFLWKETEPHQLSRPEGRQALLEDLEATIDLWLHETKYASSFATPPALTDLIVSLAQPQPGEHIYDPCCGIGGLLSAAALRLSKLMVSGQPRGQPAPNAGRIVGMELDGSLFPIALARILLSGNIEPELKIGNTLSEPLEVENATKQFDCIIANLPFGLRQPKEFVWGYPIRTPYSESLFVQHILSRLRRGGRAVVVVPESFLFRRGADVELRRRLLERYSVETVWSLPPGTFAASSSLKTSVLVIRHDGPRPDVVFVTDRLIKPFFDSRAKTSQGKTSALFTLGPDAETLPNSSTLIPDLHSEGLRAVWPPAMTDDYRWMLDVPSLHVLPAIASFSAWRWRRGEKTFEEDVRRIGVEELAKRQWELLPKRSGSEELKGFLVALQQHFGRIDLVKLSEVAEVFSGFAYRSEDIVHVKNEPGGPLGTGPELGFSPLEHPILVALIRVQDVGPRKHDKERDAVVRRPAVFLLSEALSRVREHHRLKSGDILLTRSGSVGSLGIVDEALVGAVAANGVIVVRPKDRYNSLALLRILQTAPYQTWLQSNASGSVIQHLPTRAVKELEIPFFDNEQQARLADFLQAGDSLEAFINAFRSLSGESLWTAFLLHDSDLESLLKAGRGDGYTAEWWESLRSTIEKCARLYEQGTGDLKLDKMGQGMSVWLQHANRLLDSMELPAGLERYAALQTWDKWAMHELWPAKDRQSDAQATPLHARVSQRFGSLCEVLMDAADAEANRIADSATVGIELQMRSALLGQTADLPIVVINRGLGPLRKLVVAIPELECQVHVPLLRAEETRPIPFSFKPERRGKQQIHVVWRAERINGTPVDGSEELSFEVNPAAVAAIGNPFAVNPYVTGAPVDSEGTFFGREDVIDRIHRLLRVDGPSTVILLEGNRRAGKTSILKRLQRSEHLKEWVVVYCQFQGVSGEPNAQSLYRLVARELLNGVGASAIGIVPELLRTIVEARSPLERLALCRALAASIDEVRPFERFEELLQLALAAARPRRILLMLDEFEKIHQGIEQRQMSPLVPENFRYLFHSYPELSGILSGSIRIKRLRKEYWNVLFGIGTPIAVGPLKPAAARELVVQPAEGILNYSDQAIERILTLCSFQPFLVQSLASAIFETCASSSLSSVTTELVNQSAHALVLNNEHFYTIFRQQSLTARQRFLACLIDSLVDTSTRVTFDVIRDQLEAQGIAVQSDVQLKGDLEELQEQEIITFLADTPVGYYSIAVPLFSQWLRVKVDFQAERREAIEE